MRWCLPPTPVVAVLVFLSLACGSTESHGFDDASKLSPGEAATYTGVYTQEGLPGEIHMGFHEGYVTVQLPGRAPMRLVSTGQHTFHLEGRPQMKVQFEIQNGRAVGYTVHEPQGQKKGQRTGDTRKAGDLACTPKALTASKGAPIDAEHCTLSVPENRSNPGSNLIQLSFVRLKSKAKSPGAPLIYLHGGPGGQAVSQVRNLYELSAWEPYLNICDVILLDQRGCGTSSPRLTYNADESPALMFSTNDVARKLAVRVIGEAVEHFKKLGVDLAGYTTKQNAHDLNDIRIALGAKKMSLTGFSYGTHLAQAAIKYHGEHIENVIICGVEGLDMTYKLPFNMDTHFQKLSLMVASDPIVGPYVPDMTALFQRVLKRLEKSPMVVHAEDARGNSVQVPVGPFGLQWLMRMDLGDASDVVVFPRLLYTMDQGDSSVLSWFIRKRMRSFGAVNLLLWYMDGASGASAQRWAQVHAQAKRSMFGNAMNFPFPDVSNVLGNPDLGDDFRAPLVSDVRTLFLSGSLDWNTPPQQAEQVRWGFSNSRHVVVENAGHEQILPQKEVQEAILGFLQGKEVDIARVVLPPLQFVPVTGFDRSRSHPSVSQR